MKNKHLLLNKMLKINKSYIIISVVILALSFYFYNYKINSYSHFLSCKERFGVGLQIDDKQNISSITQFDYKKINFSWYYDWWYEGIPIDDIKYSPLIGGYSWGYKFPECKTLIEMVSKNPSNYPNDTLWLVGNEIGYEDGLTPTEYAKHYDYYYSCLKGINPDYKVTIGAVYGDADIFVYDKDRSTLIWRGRSNDYIKESFIEYSKIFNRNMPIDSYNLHPYSGTDVSLFKKIIIEYREMMKSIGEQNKPLIITEFGVLEKESSEEEVIKFMHETLDFLTNAKDKELGMPSDNYRLVQKWAWFVFNQGNKWNQNTSLFDNNKNITNLGIAYGKYVDDLNDDCSKKATEPLN